MGILGLSLSLAPRGFWRLGMRRVGIHEDERTVWVQSELMRHSARDIAEAGREIGRFDSRPWLGTVRAPIAVVVTTGDQIVPVRKQRELAAAAAGPVFESAIDHLDVTTRGPDYNPALLQALDAVGSRATNKTAEAVR
jgi:hypothetical protein